MATVHLIHGFLGVGKTTFARKLERSASAIRFTHDEWMARLFGTDPPADQFADYARRVSEQIESLWPRCAELGIDVILDLNFWSREQRDRTRAIAASLGADAILYSLACSDEDAWHRIDKRNQALSSELFIARSTFEALKARFEPLEPDEDRIDIADGCV